MAPDQQFAAPALSTLRAMISLPVEGVTPAIWYIDLNLNGPCDVQTFTTEGE